MRLDHIAHRVKNKEETRKFFEECLGYKLLDTFDLKFDDGTTCECYAMAPPEQYQDMPTNYRYGVFEHDRTTGLEKYIETHEFHLAPQVFISQGEPGSIVSRWVEKNGNGIHHLAYEVDNINDVMAHWELFGIKFLSEPLVCDDGTLVQVFTEPDPYTGMTYELIQRMGSNFCRESVKALMESTDG